MQNFLRQFFFFLPLFYGSILSAQTPYCNIVLYTQSGENFQLYANGKLANSKPESQVAVTHLPTDVVKVRVVFADRQLGEINKTLYLKMGYEERHVIKRKDQQSGMESTGDQLEGQLLSLFGVSQEESSTNDRYVIRFNNSTPIPPTTTIAVTQQTTVGGETVTTHSRTDIQGSHQHSHSVHHHAHSCNHPCDYQKVLSVKGSISREAHESNKMKIAKEFIKHSCPKSFHVAEIMELFNFESNRLDLAKFAYRYVYDPEHFYVDVKDAFKMKLSADELYEYLQGKP